MSPALRFLLGLAIFSLVFCVAVNMKWGPPALSSDYLAQYKDEHFRYVGIIKNRDYKKYIQRPQLLRPEASSALAEKIAFAQTYQARQAFQQEQRRIALYENIFDVFHTLLTIAIILRFARKPLLKLLDEKIATLREKMAAAAARREEAAARKTNAAAALERLPGEEKKVDGETEQRLAREMKLLQEQNARSLEQIEREKRDRVREEELAARRRVKKELVNSAIEQVAARFVAQRDDPAQARYRAGMVDGFVRDIEARR